MRVVSVAVGLGTPLSAQEPVTAQDYLDFDARQARLGQMLFYDKILSGNQNISCGTCHHHSLNSADGVSLGIGEGGSGLGMDRTPGDGLSLISARIPRNAPALWNLGHRDMRVLFHDGRVEQVDSDGLRFRTPAGTLLPEGLNSVLAAQALFPMSSDAEMAGKPDENPVSAAFAERIDLGWEQVAERVRNTPEYAYLFRRDVREVRSKDDITIVEIANALAAFIGTEWQSFDSPYDDYLNAGTPLPPLAEKGRALFFGDAGCANCHNGPLFTDQNFYAVGVPQFGPGRAFETLIGSDVGRMEVTKLPADAYRFRTPSLRNVALTAPYGHSGAYPTLRDMIRHMCDPITSRNAWTPGMARLPQVDWLKANDFVLAANTQEMARQVAHLDLQPVKMIEEDIDAIEAFLNALTGQSAMQRPLGRPDEVPSGLPVD
ncbi:cytochrome c peroxidase [Tropicibacter naphthalenivorans]|uniref:Cytochrome c551 peroxidase n=2 Tax=Tropicibacter naphthalenivorans TaxID=441103 RepID=A0A0P1GBL4_9RHOB|nr:Cytochrome c551 peroxidase precursor [Tropicibacter naphthalenivorans]SMC81527.1 cytochrome c peroxidase [Tropicibacter naphthalenivorans]